MILFAIASLVIVVMSALYSEADDSAALASVPRRFVRFYGACVVLAAIVWLMGL